MVRSIRGYLSWRLSRAPACGHQGHRRTLLESLAWLKSPEISELDLNPVFALSPGKGLFVVDARIRVEPLERNQK
jgi:hypothetical protein